MRSLVVVEELVIEQVAGDVSDRQGALVQVPELDAGAAVGAFHAAVVLGAPAGLP